MKLIRKTGLSEEFMDLSNSPYISRPNRTGAMCLSEGLVSWWMERVANVKCRRFLEIGSFDGVLLSLMAEANPHIDFVAIDPFEAAGSTGPGHYGYWYINNKSLPNVTLYHMRSKDAIPMLIDDGGLFSCIFVDGDHSYEGAKLDIWHGWALLEEGGFMACHDSDMPEVLAACDEFAQRHPYIIEQGMCVFYKPDLSALEAWEPKVEEVAEEVVAEETPEPEA